MAEPSLPVVVIGQLLPSPVHRFLGARSCEGAVPGRHSICGPYVALARIGRGPGIPMCMGCQADPAHVAVSPLRISSFVSNSSKVSKFCTNLN
jgi:hypothetical protein